MKKLIPILLSALMLTDVPAREISQIPIARSVWTRRLP